MKEKVQIIPVLFWIGFSLLVMALSYKLGLEDKTGMTGAWNPGPGLMPFLCASLLLLVALGLLGSMLLRRSRQEKEKTKPGRMNYGKILLVLGTLFAYAFLLEKLGYLVMTFLLLGLLFWRMGTKWNYALAASVGTALLTYFLFTYLGLLFPEGILKLQGVLR
jgi:putative tricarboxylic transport membrane protein